MKSYFLNILLIFVLTIDQSQAAERKVDPDGNEYFIVESKDIEAKNKKPPTSSVVASKNVKKPEPSYKELALLMKPGCTATGDIGKASGAVISLDDFFVVIPIRANGLPPHPGDSGKDSIHGIDSDDDCIRDDIEHYVVGRFGEKHQKNIRKFLFDYAIWLDFFLIEGLDEESAKTSDDQKGEAGHCLVNILGYARARIELDALFSEFHNTFPRSERYIENLPKLGGWTRRDIEDVDCS